MTSEVTIQLMNTIPKYMWDAVKEFHDTYNPPNDPTLRATLVVEEAKEFVDSEGLEHNLKEYCDYNYVVVGSVISAMEGGFSIEDVHEKHTRGDRIILAASEIACSETEKVFSEEIVEEAFLRVHKSNMSKLGEDGKPIRREDGKILKGPNYKPAVLTDLIPDELLKREEVSKNMNDAAVSTIH